MIQGDGFSAGRRFFQWNGDELVALDAGHVAELTILYHLDRFCPQGGGQHPVKRRG